MQDLFHEDTTPKTLQHTFLDPVLRAHFAKTPMPPGSAALIDLPPDVILDTEEEIHVIAACLWIMSIRYDGLTQSERPKKPEDLRKWIIKHRREVLDKLAGKVDPPFTAWSMDQIQNDVGAMMEELLTKTLPPSPSKA